MRAGEFKTPGSLTDADNEVEVQVVEALLQDRSKQHYYVEFQGFDGSGDSSSLAAGTVKIEGKYREGGGYEEITASLDITGAASIFTDFVGAYHTLRFTSASFTANHTMVAYIRAVND